MDWENIVGHQQNINRFRSAINRNRLASTYLFVGPSGIGKKRFAKTLAQALLCSQNPEHTLIPCDGCPDCYQVRANTHPDLLLISKPSDKAFLPVELFIGTREKRMREGLCYDVSRKPFRGKRKIAIIDDVDYLNQESANALLKVLEEPPPRSLMILLGTSATRQIPTIRSRSQIIRFSPLTIEEVQQVLMSPDVVSQFRHAGILGDDESLTQPDALELARLSGGSIERAIQLADPQIREFNQRLIEQLESFDPTKDDFVSAVESFVNAAGKDAAQRRHRFVTLCDLAIGFYRTMLVEAETHVPETDSRFANCIERCLDGQAQSDANMNPSHLIETWLVDLGKLSRGELAPTIASG